MKGCREIYDNRRDIVDSYDENSKLKSILHDVEFSDSQVKDYASNSISEIILTRVYSEGFSLTIVDYVAC